LLDRDGFASLLRRLPCGAQRHVCLLLVQGCHYQFWTGLRSRRLTVFTRRSLYRTVLSQANEAECDRTKVKQRETSNPYVGCQVWQASVGGEGGGGVC